jgi:pimeloyl-ACP methyl ester carboxylesterase
MLKRRTRTPPYRDQEGKPIAGSIAEAGYLDIGGVDQWVMVRGRSLENPLLVLLHGGPGSPETALFRTANAELEDAYTVVYWEQRGAGRSYHPTIDPASMTLERFVADLDELIEILLAKLGQPKLVLLGHSWGSLLGVEYAARHPGKVSAYVGVGQVADMARSEAASYAFTLSEAERRERPSAVRALRAIGPPPYPDLRSAGVQRRWLAALGGVTGPGFSIAALILRASMTPEASLWGLVRLARGSLFSLRRMESELADAKPAARIRRFAMPVFFVVGRHDNQVAATVSAEYFEAIEAPHKALSWLERSGHLAPFEEPEAFNRLMIDMVRPHAATEVVALPT